MPHPTDKDAKLLERRIKDAGNKLHRIVLCSPDRALELAAEMIAPGWDYILARSINEAIPNLYLTTYDAKQDPYRTFDHG